MEAITAQYLRQKVSARLLSKNHHTVINFVGK